MQEWRTVQLQIKSILEGISGVEYVLDYEPDVTSFEELKPYLTEVTRNVDKLNLWIVQRTAFRTERGGRGNNTPLCFKKDIDVFTIDGFIGYTGLESFIEFNNTVENIREEFTANISLGSAEAGWMAGPIANGDIAMAEFLGILCHSCSMNISVEKQSSAGYR